MSINSVPAQEATATSDEESDKAVSPADVYWTLIKTNGRICPWCVRWQVPRHEVAAGPIEVAGVEADVAPDAVADVEHDHPPRVPRPSGDEETELIRYRACQPEQRICECGDVDSEPYQTLSKEKALSLVPRLARRVGEFGYVYSLDTLYEEVKVGKSDPGLSGDDDLVFELAIAVAIVDACGGDVAAVREEVLDA